MHWSGGWIAPKACCSGIAARIDKSLPDSLRHERPLPCPHTSVGRSEWHCCQSQTQRCGLLVAPMDTGSTPFSSDQTRSKNSHHTEALLKVASVCAALQHFWIKLIVCLLHMGWAETKKRLFRIQHQPPWMHPLRDCLLHLRLSHLHERPGYVVAGLRHPRPWFAGAQKLPSRAARAREGITALRRPRPAAAPALAQALAQAATPPL